MVTSCFRRKVGEAVLVLANLARGAVERAPARRPLNIVEADRSPDMVAMVECTRDVDSPKNPKYMSSR
jgi:hypothetical protein